MFTKLPSSIFRDFRPHGALFSLLAACYQFKSERGYEGTSRFELSFDPQEQNAETENLQLFQYILAKLEVVRKFVSV
jgi:hypothetical protein